mgnify:CR=1 FL=1
MKVEWMRRISARDNAPTELQSLELCRGVLILLNSLELVPEEN